MSGNGSRAEAKHKSDTLFAKLQAKGREEKWAIQYKQLKFVKNGKFGSGSGGEVFRVEWRGLDCVAKTCPKTVGPQVLIDLANEIKVLSTLRHPNLVMFLGACFEPGESPIMLMEYCSGGSLEKKLCRCDAQGLRLAAKTALKYTLQLAIGMNFLHQCNPPVVHRDLKPSNILLTEGDQIKITDFGLSKFIPKRKAKQKDKYNMTGETGSYRFMAPEVFRHDDYDEKVDVYSFALVVYWMLAGHRPFADIFDPIEAARLASTGARTPNEKAVKVIGLRSVLQNAWSLNPEERPDFEEIVDIVKTMGKASNGPCCIQ